MSSFDSSRIDDLLAAAAAAGDVPGVIAAVGTPDEVLYHSAFGTLAAGGDPPAAPDTVVRIASMTKALSTVAVLQLVDRGLVSLDEPVATYVPAFADLQVLDGFDGDTPRLRAPATQATVRQLLTHTAGLGYFFLDENLARWHETTGSPTVLDFDVRALEAPLINDPGTAWAYGTNTDFAGLVVEAASGQKLEAYLDEHLFGPLGMSDTTFRASADQLARAMPIHARLPDGGLMATDLEWPAESPMAFAGHGAYSTAGDYLRFLRALLRGGELDGTRVLSAERVDEMFSGQIGDIPLPEVIRSARKDLSNDIPSLPVAQTWGLGLHLTLEDVPGMRRAGTGDWAGLTNCYYWVDRTSGVAALFLTQVLPFFDERIVTAAMGFEAAIYTEVGAAVG